MVGLGHDGRTASWTARAGMVAGGRDLVSGEVAVLADRRGPVVVEDCRTPARWCSAANRFYQRPAEFSVPAYQLTWAHATALPLGRRLPVRAGVPAPAGDVAGVTGQPRPRSRRSLATWPVALTL